VFLVHRKLCQAKMCSFGKKLKKHFCSKKPQNCFLGKLKNEAFSIDISSISLHNHKQTLNNIFVSSLQTKITILKINIGRNANMEILIMSAEILLRTLQLVHNGI